MAYTAYLNTVERLYVDYLQRAADPAGLRYWAEKLDAAGGDVNAIIPFIASSPEYTALYGPINSTTINGVVNLIYEGLFGRAADAGGLAFWVGEFNAGRVTASNITLKMLDGAGSADLQAFNNKLTAATLFTSTIDPGLDNLSLQATYPDNTPLNDITYARTFLAGVTGNTATIPTQAQTTAFIQNYIANPGDPIMPSFALTASASSVNEGSTVNFTLATTNVAVGSNYDYTITGTGINAADVVGGSLSGTATIGADGKAIIPVNLAADATTEGNETLKLTVAGKDASVTVVDTSTTPIPTFDLTASASSVNEGKTVYFTLATTNVAPGSTYDYTITGTVSAADIIPGSLKGSATIGADGKAIIPVILVADNLTEGNETLKLTIAGKDASVTVVDTSTTPIPTFDLTASAPSVNEGNTVYFTLATTNVAEGSKYDYTITGTVNAADVAGGLLAGTATIGADGKAIIPVTLVADATTEGPETLKMTVAGLDTSVTVNDTSITPAKTFILTNLNDVFIGTDYNDTFQAGKDEGLQSLNPLDSLDGGKGIDTLNAQINVDVTPQHLDNIEIINVTFTKDPTLNLLHAGQLLNLNNIGSTADGTISNIVSTDVDLSLQDTNDGGQTFSFKDTSGKNTVDMTISNVTGNTDVIIPGVEVINFTSTGSPNAIDVDCDKAETLNFKGDAAMKIDQTIAGGSPNVSRIDAGGLNADFYVNTGNLGSPTVIGGSGNDTLHVEGNTGAISVEGGKGNDTIYAGSNFTPADTIKGGDGTDRLIITNASATTAVCPDTGIEELEISDELKANLNVNNIDPEITKLFLTEGDNGGNTITGPAGNFNIYFGDDLDGKLTINDTGTATNDTLLIENDTSKSFMDDEDLTVNGYETVTIDTGTGGTTDQDFGNITLNPDGGTSWLNFIGANRVFFDGGDTITANVIDAEGLDPHGSGWTFRMDTAAAGGLVSIFGSSGNDVLRGDASSFIRGESGNDSLFGGTGNDTIHGGPGSDTITGNGGNDYLKGGPDDDSIIGGAGSDTIYGNDGNDTIEGAGGNNLIYGDEGWDVGGNDLISVTSGNNQIFGGDGNDTITAGTGKDSIWGDAGDDRIIFGANLDVFDTVNGGDGTDTLVVDVGGGLSAANASGISQIEILELIGTSSNQDLFNVYDENPDLFEIDAEVTAGHDLTLTNATPSVTDLVISKNNAGFTLSLARLFDTGANALDVTLTAPGGDLLKNLTINDEEMVTINSYGGGAHKITDTLSATDLTSLTIYGDENLTIKTLNAANLTTLYIQSTGDVTITDTLNSKVVTTIDAVVTSGDVTIDASNSTKNMTVTGGYASSDEKITTGSGNDYFYFGYGNDTLDGGPGSDTIYGDLGNDSLLGGLGNDFIDGGSGNDTIIGGAGGDTLTGGSGVDKFSFVQADSVLGNLDITDYRSSGADTIDITTYITAAGNGGGGKVQDFTAAANLQAAIDLAANNNTVANGLSVFLYGGNTYAYVEVAPGGITYAPTDWVVQISGQPFAAGANITGLGIDSV